MCRPMTRVVITGAGGQVGYELCRQSWPAEFEVVPLTRANLDIADPVAVARDITPNCDIVINVAAYTAVDRAETERELAWRVNEQGPRTLAARCAELNIPLIHVSTDYVFDGKKASPYLESDGVGPVNEYGRSKLAGENAVRETLARHIILRTSSVFGESGANFVKTMLRLGAQRPSLKIVADQVSCPTPARDIATALVSICRTIGMDPSSVEWGTYHFCGGPEVTWSQFANAIFALNGARGAHVPQIIDIEAKDYRTDARRPVYSVMGCEKIANNFKIARPDWAEGLADVVNSLSNGGGYHGH
jgi:dTDP-4-dehydrorhamnose reductase